MKPDDIEILDDFSNGEKPVEQSINQSAGQAPAILWDDPVPSEPLPSVEAWDAKPSASEPLPSVEAWDTKPSASEPLPSVDAMDTIPSVDPLMAMNEPQITVEKPIVEENPTPVAPVSEFDKMVAASAEPAPETNSDLFYVPKEPVNNPLPNNQSYENGFNSNDYVADANNDLVESTGGVKEDLTITAVYPNGLAVDKAEEIENTQVIKPKKKGSGDLPLIIIVAVLAITLVVLLIVFYL